MVKIKRGAKLLTLNNVQCRAKRESTISGTHDNNDTPL